MTSSASFGVCNSPNIPRTTLRLAALLAIFAMLPACGGGGGGGGDQPPPPPTYSISGMVTKATDSSGLSGISMALTGTKTASTSTDASGRYSFSGLANGNYTVTPTRSGTEFSPSDRPVTIANASVNGLDFIALSGRVVATGIEFLPEWFSSAEQLRASLVVKGSHVYFTDSSASPLKRAAIDGSGVTSLAGRFRRAYNLVLRGQQVYWIDESTLYVTSLADGATTLLAEGSPDHGDGTTVDLVVDDSFVYWANSVATPNCSPPCTWVIQKVPHGGGPSITLATVDRKVGALTADATRLFWEEESMEPYGPGCNCGSTIKSIAKTGGASTILVDGGLNGTLPTVPPGQIPGSWLPTGGLALTASEVVFAKAGMDYEVKAIPLDGGTPRTLVSVPTGSYYSSRALQGLAVRGDNVYFIDNVNHAVNRVPLAGGPVTALATDIGSPSALNSSVMVLGSSDVYWSETGTVSGCCLMGGTGVIRRVPLAGGAASTVMTGLDEPGSLGIDGSNLAWTELWRVARGTTGGANVATVVSGIEGNMARITADSTHLYVLDGGFVKKVPLAGGRLEKLAYTGDGRLHDLSATVQDITTDGISVYWTAYGGPSAPVVRKVSVNGGATTIIGSEASFVSPQDCYWRLAVQGPHVYWSAGGSSGGVSCAVKRVGVNGGTVETVIDYPYLAEFAVDDSFVYFADGSSALVIRKVPVTGGTPSLVASNAAGWVMTQYGSRLYWVDLLQDTVAWIEKSAGGGSPTFIPGGLYLEPSLAFEGLTVDSSGLYVTETQAGTIYRLN